MGPILDGADTKFSITIASSFGKCCTDLTGFRRTRVDQSSCRKTSWRSVEEAAGCLDSCDHESEMSQMEINQVKQRIWLTHFWLSPYWHCKEKGHVETDKQELLVGWLVSWWRKAGEKLRRHVIQKKQGDYQGNGGALNRMTGPPLWVWELTRSADSADMVEAIENKVGALVCRHGSLCPEETGLGETAVLSGNDLGN